MIPKTITPKAGDLRRRWWLIDAEGQTLGRLASQVAQLLRGKHHPNYAPHMDMGDHVVIVNAEKIHVTGTKMDVKLYRRHTGYPGGLREVPMRVVLNRFPDRVILQAVKGMLPQNKLSRQLLKKLKVYGGPEHPHAGQDPQPYALDKGGPQAAAGGE
jgi:large subunit ribosomal protein L13